MERLPDLWRLGPGEVIAVVGGGGKSTLLERLAADFEAAGKRVLLTTTTKVWPPDEATRPLLLAGSAAEAAELIGDAVAAGGPSPVLGRAVLANGKLEGVPPDWVEELAALPGLDAVLVEADGSLGRPLKAPAPWEPVIPACASLVVAVAGLEAQGASLDERTVHRPERVGNLLGVPLGTRLSPAHLVTALVSGYASAAPRHARMLLLFNKADLRPPADALIAAAREAGLEAWAGSLRREDQPRCLHVPPQSGAAIVLAAGLASRMGGPKVLARLGGGTVLGRVLKAALESGLFARVLVVVGRDEAQVRLALREELPEVVIEIVPNPRPEQGLSSSLRVAADKLGAEEVAVLLGDQPFVSAGTLARLAAARTSHPRAAAVALDHGPALGPPVLLHPALLPRLGSLSGDRGARRLLERFREDVILVSAEPMETLDLDTPADLEEARRRLEEGG